MGACLNAQNQQSAKHRRLDNYLAQNKSFPYSNRDSINTQEQFNPEQNIITQQLKKTKSPTEASGDFQQSFMTLSKLLNQENQDGQKLLDEWQNHNSESKIVRMSKKSSRKLISKGSIMEEIDKTQTLDICTKQTKTNQTLELRAMGIDFQFSLPKCRAGPLVIPYIHYNAYLP